MGSKILKIVVALAFHFKILVTYFLYASCILNENIFMTVEDFIKQKAHRILCGEIPGTLALNKSYCAQSDLAKFLCSGCIL